MDIREGFLKDILENPEDDFPRLALADWLLENGDEFDRVRGEFIHVQMSLDKLGEPLTSWPLATKTAFHDLRRKEEKLWSSKRPDSSWVIDSSKGGLGGDHYPFPDVIHQNGAAQRSSYECLVWRRGFMDEVRCKYNDWLRYGPDIVRENPVCQVRLVNREPFQDYPADRWWFRRSAHPDTHHIGPLWEFLPGCYKTTFFGDKDGTLVQNGFATREEAIEGLSRAALLWARSLARTFVGEASL